MRPYLFNHPRNKSVQSIQSTRSIQSARHFQSIRSIVYAENIFPAQGCNYAQKTVRDRRSSNIDVLVANPIKISTLY